MSEIDPIKRIEELSEEKAKNDIERNILMEKAFKSEDPNTIYKAQQLFSRTIPKNKSNNGAGKAMAIDPFDNSTSLGYYNKNSTLSFEVLRGMSHTPIVKAIIGTRKDQIAEYAAPQSDKYSRGFIIRKSKSGRFQGHQEEDLTSEEDLEVDTLIDFLLNSGDEANRWGADSFEIFLRKIVEDSLAMDQGCFEIVRYRSGEIAEFMVRDGATMRIADSYDRSNAPETAVKIDGYYPAYTQVYQGQVHAEFYPWELAYIVRNPQTSIYQNGYGRSELEDLILSVSAMLNGDAYNANFFKNGSNPKGLLMVKDAAGLDNSKLTEFKNEWQSMLTGVENSHKTPILDGEFMNWVDLTKTNRDMEFSKFQEYLIKLTCANYKISPEEVGFTLENAATPFGGRRGSDEKEYSKEKGLIPLLKTIQRYINSHIIGPKSAGKYELVFVGHNQETEREEEERIQKSVATYLTVNEARKIRGFDEIEGGDIVLNPVMAASLQQGNASSAFMSGTTGLDDNVDAENGEEDFDNKSMQKEFDENPMVKDLNNWIDDNLR